MSAMIAVGRAVRDEGLLGFYRSGREMEELRQERAQKKSRPNLDIKKMGMGKAAIV